MNDYCAGALAYLSHSYDPDRALFSCSSRCSADGQVVNDFSTLVALRYTINTYLGLSEAERCGGPIEWLGNVRSRVGEFLAQHEQALDNCGDHGLLLVLLAAVDRSHPAAGRSLGRIERAVNRPDASRRLNLQELAWMLWGVTSWAHEPRAQALAHRLFGLIRTDFVDSKSHMRHHSVARYRAHTVSFGSIVYFLCAMHEYRETFDSGEAGELFRICALRVLALQGSDGAWPWMIDVRAALPIDVYPIFSVHQDSMSMLFLFPAEICGIPGVAGAIERSLRWNLGHNELEASPLRSEPYAWFYRSIERTERWPRAPRYLRSVGRGGRDHPARSPHVRLNRECRSYHLGWVPYAWSGRAHHQPGEAWATPERSTADAGRQVVI